MKANQHIAVAILSLAMFCIPASAQPLLQRPASAESAFLVELAQRMVARGEIAEAQGVIERLRASDPNNPALKELTQQVQSRTQVQQQPKVSASSRSREIASDINAIQQSIQRYERRNRDSEFLIRQLVQENDMLAQTLTRRNRSLLELMKKVYGENATLPEVEVDVERTQRIIKGYQDQIVERDRQLVARNQELSDIVGKINQINESLKTEGGGALSREQTPPLGRGNDEAVAVELNQKRDHLVDKSIVLMDKSRDLSLMQTELTRFADLLKDTDRKYVEAFKEYDARVQKLKEDWAQDKLRQQDEISSLKRQLAAKGAPAAAAEQKAETDANSISLPQIDKLEKETARHESDVRALKKDLAAKVMELEKVRSEIASRAPALNERKDELAKKDAAIAQVDAAITDKDREIMKLKGLLVQQDKQIAEQTDLIGFIDDKTKDLSKRVVVIRQSLSDGDRALNELKTRIRQLKGRPEADDDAVLNAEIKDWKQQLEGSLKTLKQQAATIDDLKTRLEEVQAVSGEKDVTLARQRGVIETLEARLKSARTDAETLRGQLEGDRRKMEILAENAESFKANAATSSEQAVELSQRVYDLEEKLAKSTTDTANENKFLKETLDQRDKEAVNLRKDLLGKEEQLKFFYEKMNQATKTLNANTLSKDSTPTPPSWPNQPGSVPGNDTPWDPKNNDPYALQQRLATSSKELQMVRQELTEKVKLLEESQKLLKAKDEELRAQREDYHKVLAAETAQIEARKGRGQDESLRVMQLEEKKIRVEQELGEVKSDFAAYKKDAEKQIRDLKSQDNGTAALTAQLDKKNKELERVVSELKEKTDEVELQREALDHESQKVETLKKELAEANKLINLGEGKFGNKDLSIQELKARVNNATIRERDYKARIKDIEGHLRESYKMVELGEDRLRRLKEQLEIREGRITSLNKEVERLRKLLHDRQNPGGVITVPYPEDRK